MGATDHPPITRAVSRGAAHLYAALMRHVPLPSGGLIEGLPKTSAPSERKNHVMSDLLYLAAGLAAFFALSAYATLLKRI